MRKIGQIFKFLIPVIALAALVVFMTGAGRRERARLEKNKAIVHASVEKFWNTGDLAVADEFYATNFVNNDPNNPDVRDLEGFKKWVGATFAGFPDHHVIVEDMIAEGDKVVKSWTTNYTHTGEFMGMPRTGKRVTIEGITIYRIAGGKIVENWWSYDLLRWFQQMGFKLVPAK